MKEKYLDRIFRIYGEEFFGKKFMDTISSEEIEAARCWAFRRLGEMTAFCGKQSDGTLKELFCNCIFGRLWVDDEDLWKGNKVLESLV